MVAVEDGVDEGLIDRPAPAGGKVRQLLTPVLQRVIPPAGPHEDIKCEALHPFEHWDAALHQAIAEATHNPLIVAIYATITGARELAEWGELKRLNITAERRDAYRHEHREIVAALRAHDGRTAEAALTAHLLRVRRNLLGE
ncbi:FadR/GntR family transcriptional regulator [Ancylobacter sp. SL191]|uniref:FadR/GntR family transcriptional regulator n=1 Tax=Ancylobacter sp. SL191 TaxID=2995166 RepID=UPI002271BC49|nr:FCD domain-containing protein [Ancylobacter sp. SL191]WAC29335.1 FCD domain-containing protein [Ancylobacter sp. SL191]